MGLNALESWDLYAIMGQRESMQDFKGNRQFIGS